MNTEQKDKIVQLLTSNDEKNHINAVLIMHGMGVSADEIGKLYTEHVNTEHRHWDVHWSYNLRKHGYPTQHAFMRFYLGNYCIYIEDFVKNPLKYMNIENKMRVLESNIQPAHWNITLFEYEYKDNSDGELTIDTSVILKQKSKVKPSMYTPYLSEYGSLMVKHFLKRAGL